MSYQILARKYRPQDFSEIKGQDAIVKTLENAITLNRLHQAYLFCGARGVGKTSLARILAKSLNCDNGPTLKPCQKCTACLGITKSNSMDVLEIDGASNTGVDDIRQLREQAKYMPSSRYKIYIIDEVHMLSTSAFNALLKILEEPPAHLIFIFATTEPHKIPVTILSRCQRFDFRRLNHSELMNHLKNILQTENLNVDDNSLNPIVQCAEGSVRDSLSLLDQVISFCGDKPETKKVREILGLADRVLLFESLEAILKESPEKALEIANTIYSKGYDFKIFCESLLEMIRHLLVIKEGGSNYVDVSPDELERLTQLSELKEATHFLTLFQILSKATEDIARSDFAKLIFECAFIKMIKVRELIAVSELIQQLNSNSVNLNPDLPLKNSASIPTKQQIPQTQTAISEPVKNEVNTSKWHAFVQKVLSEKPQIGSLLEHGIPVKAENNEIILAFEKKSIYKDMLQDKMDVILNCAHHFFNQPVQIKFEDKNNQTVNPTSHEIRIADEKKQAEDLKNKALSHPAVKKAQEMLGAKIKEIILNRVSKINF